MDTLGALRDLWLELRCGCGRVVCTPGRLLVRAHGADARTAEIVARMRCSACHAAPVAAALVDDPRRGESGYVGSAAQVRVAVR